MRLTAVCALAFSLLLTTVAQTTTLAPSVGTLQTSRLDLNIGILLLSFSDPLVINTFQVGRIGFTNTSDGDALVTLVPGQDSVLTQSAGNQVILSLSAQRLLELKLNANLLTTIANSFIVIDQGVSTVVGQSASAAGTNGLPVALTTLTADDSAPFLESAAMADFNNSGLQVLLTVSEPLSSQPSVELASDSSTTTLTIVSMTQALSNNGNRVIVSLVLQDPETVRAVLKAAVTNAEAIQISLPSNSLVDQAGNTQPVARSVAVDISQVDVLSPQLVSAEFIFTTGSLDLLFSEAVDEDSFTLTALSLSTSTGTVIDLATSTLFVDVADERVLVLFEPTTLQVLQADLTITGNHSQIVFTDALLKDLAGNSVRPGNASVVPVADGRAPLVESAVLDFVNEQLLLTTSEPLLLSSVTPSALSIRLVGGSLVLVPFTGANATYLSPLATEIAIAISPATQRELETAIVNVPGAIVQIINTASFATDVFGSATPGSGVNAVVVPATDAPVLQSASLHQAVVADQAQLTLALTFNEVVVPSVTELPLTLTRFTQTVASTSAVAQAPLQTVTLDVSNKLTELRSASLTDDAAAIAAGTLVSLQASLLRNAFGIPNAAVNNIAVNASSLDLLGPVLQRVALDLPNRRFALTYDEPLRRLGFPATRMVLFEVEGQAFNVSVTNDDVSLLGDKEAAVAFGDELEAMLSQAIANNTNATVVLTEAPSVVADVHLNPSLVAANASVLTTVELIVDVGAPVLTSSSFDVAEGVIRLSFNEELFGFVLAANGVGLQNTANTLRANRRRDGDDAGVFYPLQDALVTQSGRDVIVTLGPDDRAVIEAIPNLGSKPSNTFLVLDGDISDAFGNQFTGAGRGEAQGVESVTGADDDDDDDDFWEWYWIAIVALAGALLLTFVLCVVCWCRACRRRPDRQSKRASKQNNGFDASWDPAGQQLGDATPLPERRMSHSHPDVIVDVPAGPKPENPKLSLPPPPPPPPGDLTPGSAAKNSPRQPRQVMAQDTGIDVTAIPVLPAAVLRPASPKEEPVQEQAAQPVATWDNSLVLRKTKGALHHVEPEPEEEPSVENQSARQYQERRASLRHTVTQPVEPATDPAPSTDYLAILGSKSQQERSPKPHRHSLQVDGNGSVQRRPGKYSPEELEYRLSSVMHGMSPAHSDNAIRASVQDAARGSSSSPLSLLLAPGGDMEGRERSASISSRTEPPTEEECSKSLVDADIEAMVGEKVTALYEYFAQEEDELTVEPQEELVIVSSADNGWCKVRSTKSGEEGLLPQLYVALEYGAQPGTEAPPKELVHTRSNSMDHVVDDEGFRYSGSGNSSNIHEDDVFVPPPVNSFGTVTPPQTSIMELEDEDDDEALESLPASLKGSAKASPYAIHAAVQPPVKERRMSFEPSPTRASYRTANGHFQPSRGRDLDMHPLRSNEA
eukprot:m.222746 g.222746  ORF g.222746 m.222746 type:complete len:1433 (+) comp17256_c0_seq2:277-4575(+)